MELIKRRLSVVLAVLFCCFSAVSFTSCSDDEDEEDCITKSATASDGTKAEFKMTFKNGVSEFLYAKTDYATEELAIEADKSMSENAEEFEGTKYISHTRNGKVIDAKYEVSGMDKQTGTLYLDMMASVIDGSFFEDSGMLDGDIYFEID